MRKLLLARHVDCRSVVGLMNGNRDACQTMSSRPEIWSIHVCLGPRIKVSFHRENKGVAEDDVELRRWRQIEVKMHCARVSSAFTDGDGNLFLGLPKLNSIFPDAVMYGDPGCMSAGESRRSLVRLAPIMVSLAPVSKKISTGFPSPTSSTPRLLGSMVMP